MALKWLFVLLFFVGCSSDVTSKIEDKSIVGVKIDSFEIEASDALTKAKLKKIVQDSGFKISKSRYKLYAENRVYKNSCNNALIKATTNTSYDGMLYIELQKDNIKAYSAFMDYKGSDIDSLLKKLFKTLPINKK